MQAILIQQKCAETLKVETFMSINLTKVEDIKMVDKSKNVNIVCLKDIFIRGVARENIVANM